MKRFILYLFISLLLLSCTEEERKAFEKKVINKYSDIPKVEGILSEREVLRIAASDRYNVGRLKHHFGDIRNLKPGIFVLVYTEPFCPNKNLTLTNCLQFARFNNYADFLTFSPTNLQ